MSTPRTANHRPSYKSGYKPWDRERRAHLFDGLKLLMLGSALMLVMAKLIV